MQQSHLSNHVHTFGVRSGSRGSSVEEMARFVSGDSISCLRRCSSCFVLLLATRRWPLVQKDIETEISDSWNARMQAPLQVNQHAACERRMSRGCRRRRSGSAEQKRSRCRRCPVSKARPAAAQARCVRSTSRISFTLRERMRSRDCL